VRGAEELAIWERWLVRDTQVKTEFGFFVPFYILSPAWARTRSLPSYTEENDRNVTIRPLGTVVSCRRGACIVQLSLQGLPLLSDERRTVVFSWGRLPDHQRQ
jgi:hypothetical protein